MTTPTLEASMLRCEVPESDEAALYAAQLAERIKRRLERDHDAQMRVYRKTIKRNRKP